MNKFELLEIFGFGRPFQKDEAAIGWRCRYGDKLFGDFIHMSKPDFEDPEILILGINKLLEQFVRVMNKLEEEQEDMDDGGDL